MHKAIAILTILFAIYATLGFGRRQSTPPPQNSTVYYKSTMAPAKQSTTLKKVVF